MLSLSGDIYGTGGSGAALVSSDQSVSSSGSQQTLVSKSSLLIKPFPVHRYMGIGLSAQGVNMNRLPGESRPTSLNNKSLLHNKVT